MRKAAPGFTLIEILIVVAIIGILALIVFLALNPAGRFADSRNTTRTQNIEAIGKAILQYSTDKAGWPTGLPQLNNTSSDTNGLNTSTGAPDCNFSAITATNHDGCEWADDATLVPQIVPQYLAAMPADSGTYMHFFVALAPDNSHIFIMSDSMEKGVSTNPNGQSWYFTTD